MTHEEASRRVLEFVYGELDPRAAREFEDLLESDSALRAEVDAFREVRQAAAGLAREPLPADLKRGLVRAAKARAAARRRRRRLSDVLEKLFLSPAFSGALVVVVVATVGGQLMTRLGPAERLSSLDAERRSGEIAAVPARPAPASAAGPAARTLAAAAPVTPETAAGGGKEGFAADGTKAKASADAARTQGHARAEELQEKKALADLGGPAPRERRGGDLDAAGAASGAGVRPAAKAPAAKGAIGRASTWSDKADVLGYFSAEPAASAPAPASAPSSGVEAGETRSFARAPAAAAPVPEAEAENASAQDRGPAPQSAPTPPPPSPAKPAPAPATAAAMEAAPVPPADESAAKKEAKPEEPKVTLERARRLKTAGYLEAALTAYRKAVLGLSGNDLRQALREAAAVATALHRESEARELERRAADVK